MRKSVVSSKEAKQYLKEYKEGSQPFLMQFLAEEKFKASGISKIPAELIRKYTDLTSRGKRIRGALVRLGYEIAGGKNTNEILSTSIFIELFHSGLLVHDDIMDDDEIRRGKVSVHEHFSNIATSLGVVSDSKFFGQSMGILLGDLAFYLSWHILLNSKLPKDNVLKAANTYQYHASRVVYGQSLDVATASIKSISERDVYKIIKYKTAEYTGVMPLLVGANLGGTKERGLLKSLENFGLHLGWAFQIQDDILGLFGKEDKLGKPVGSDITECKNTLLMVELEKRGNKEQLRFRDSLFCKDIISETDIEKMKLTLVESGCLESVKQRGWEHVIEGMKEVDKITKSTRHGTILKSLLYYMMERTL